MGLFDKQKQIDALKADIDAMSKQNDSLRAEIKGYYTEDNDDNELFKALYHVGQMIDFNKFDMYALKDTYMTNTAVYGIIERISSATSELLSKVELIDSDDNVIKRHWILDLLRNPNDRESGKKYVGKWSRERLIYGNAFTYSERRKGTRLGEIKAMYIAPAYQCAIKMEGDKKPVSGMRILRFQNQTIDNESFYQSFTYNPDVDTFFGLSPIAVAASEVQLMRAGAERQNTAMKNGAVNTIVTPAGDKMGVLPQDAKELEDTLNDKENFNRSMFVRRPIATHQIGSTPVDLGILDTKKDSVTALCFAFNIPVDLYYGQSKYENAKEAKKAIFQFAAIPLMNEFLEDFMAYLSRIDKKGEINKLHLAINTDKVDELRDNANEVMQNLTSMYASVNERREYMGYEAIEEDWANKPILPMGVQFGNEFGSDDVTDIDENAKELASNANE